MFQFRVGFVGQSGLFSWIRPMTHQSVCTSESLAPANSSSASGSNLSEKKRRSATLQELMPILCMALGTFAIGTEGFMIAPLLPKMAVDFGHSVSTVAQLVTVFTITLALSSPVMTVLTANLNRRNVLLWSMALFTAGNIFAWLSSDYSSLMIARILLAIASGLYVPNANALAGAIAGPEKRGQALAIVSGGMTIAIALGLPLGSLIGHALGWRATFFAVGGMSLIAAAGIYAGVNKDAGREIRVAGLAERVKVATSPAVLKPLLVTAFWAMGAYTAYPFIAPYLSQTLNFAETGIGATVSLWGASAAVGVLIGGKLTDRIGYPSVIVPSLLLLALAFAIMAFSALALTPDIAFIPVLAAISLWGITVWSFFPAQMANLINAGGPQTASVTLSLNTSVMYAGFSLGSAMGSIVIAAGNSWQIGAVAAISEIVALAIFLGTRRAS